MSLLDDWSPLGLPRGSVRALVTLGLLTVFWILLYLGRDVPTALGFSVLVTTGYYFGSRSRGGRSGRQPLFLPRGSIRTIIVAGSALVGYFLFQNGRLDFGNLERSTAMFSSEGALVGGFTFKKLIELLFRGKLEVLHKWMENIKALLVTTAAGGLGLTSLLGLEGETSSQLALLAAPFVVFYFGSRK